MCQFRNTLILLLLTLSLSVSHAENVAFFYALDADFECFKHECGGEGVPLKVGSNVIKSFSVGPHKLYAVKTGVGSAATALVAAGLFTTIQIDYAISVGPVGSLSGKLKIGQWGDVECIKAYSRGSETPNGFIEDEKALFLLPPFKEFWKPTEMGLKSFRVASGETFYASENARSRLASETQMDSVDMNSFGLALACQSYKLPLIAWRIVSDNADDNAGRDFATFIRQYKGIGGKWVFQFVENLPQNPSNPLTHPNLKKVLESP